MAKKGKDEDVYEATQEKEKNDVGVDTNLSPPLVFELTTGKSYIGALHTQTPLFWWPTHCHICNFLLLLEHTYQYDDDIDGPHLQSVKFLCLQTVLFLIQSDHCLVLSICP